MIRPGNEEDKGFARGHAWNSTSIIKSIAAAADEVQTEDCETWWSLKSKDVNFNSETRHHRMILGREMIPTP